MTQEYRITPVVIEYVDSTGYHADYYDDAVITDNGPLMIVEPDPWFAGAVYMTVTAPNGKIYDITSKAYRRYKWRREFISRLLFWKK